MLVAEALDSHPGAAEVFARLGYRCVDLKRNDWCVVVEQDTLEAAARLHDKSLAELLAELMKLPPAEEVNRPVDSARSFASDKASADKPSGQVSPEPSRGAQGKQDTDGEKISGDAMKMAATLAILTACVAAFQWYQIGYRWWLFVNAYHRELYVNHIGEEDFPLIYGIDALCILVGAICLAVAWERRRRVRLLLAIPLVMNIVGAATIFWMHWTGVLVGYAEFIEYWKTGAPPGG